MRIEGDNENKEVNEIKTPEDQKQTEAREAEHAKNGAELDSLTSIEDEGIDDESLDGMTSVEDEDSDGKDLDGLTSIEDEGDKSDKIESKGSTLAKVALGLTLGLGSVLGIGAMRGVPGAYEQWRDLGDTGLETQQERIKSNDVSETETAASGDGPDPNKFTIDAGDGVTYEVTLDNHIVIGNDGVICETTIPKKDEQENNNA